MHDLRMKRCFPEFNIHNETLEGFKEQKTES